VAAVAGKTPIADNQNVIVQYAESIGASP
jgi:hypothetical protein